MRTPLLCLVALASLAGCKKEAQPAPLPEATAGDEIPGTSVPPAMAGIAPDDVELEIWAIDVGQGDATLIVGPPATPGGERFSILVDAGQGKSTRAIEPALADAGVEQLSVFIATHFDDDHVGGATTVSGTSVLWTTDEVGGELECEARAFFPSVAVVDSGPSITTSSTEEQWHECVDQLTGGTDQPAHIVVASGKNLGRVFSLGGGYIAEIVAGGGHVLGTNGQIPSATSKNERSVALLVSNEAGFDFLVTGDLIGQPAAPQEPNAKENAPLEARLGEKLAADGIEVEILQVGHHGAANATENSFIASIQPVVAIISVGIRNSHGHPRTRTLVTLEENDVPFILQTSPGKPEEDETGHVFEVCDETDPACVPTKRFAVNGSFHVTVDGDLYDIRSIEDSSYDFKELGTLTALIELECDSTGCDVVEP